MIQRGKSGSVASRHNVEATMSDADEGTSIMITAVEIENFKGIHERTRIELKPITLLFGPTSAGKSTLLHALQLAREIFTRRNLDVDVTDGGAGFIDLGGFRNYVHGRDLTKAVTLRFDLDL